MNFQTFKKLYLGDYTNEGYNYGLADAKERHPKNRFRFFKAVHPVNLIWNFNNSWESFQRTYDKGYIDGERVIHHIYDDQHKIKGGTDTMSDTSLENQIRLLESFEKELNLVYKKIETLNQDYKRQISALDQLGFISNYVKTLKERYDIFDSKISNILLTIKTNLETIKEQKEALKRQL